MFQGVIFDKDGTLFDFRRSWVAWAAELMLVLGGGDRARARDLGAIIGFDLDAMEFAPDSVVIAGTPVEVATDLLPHLPDMTLEGLVDQMNLLAASAPLAEVVPLRAYLMELRAQGLRIGLATNDAEAPAHAHLDRAGVHDLFDFIAGCDSGHGAKPAPGQLLAFCAQTGLRPDQVIMVGDSLHDLEAARHAGMWPVAVLTGIARADVLAPAAEIVLEDIGGLQDWMRLRAAS